MFRHILVPTDGSKLAQDAVNKAVALAAESQARLTFFFANPDIESSVYGEAALLRTLDQEMLNRAINAKAQEILKQAQGVASSAGLANTQAIYVTSDEPYSAIISAAEAQQCDLILMASHGHRGVKGLLLGSQTQKVLTHSKIPVLVFR